MKVVIAVDSYPPAPGGVASHARRLGLGLTRLGHEVAIVTAAPKDHVGEVDGLRVVKVRLRLQRLPGAYKDAALPFVPPWSDRSLANALREASRSLRADVIHAHGWSEMAAREVSDDLSIPLVVTLHDYGLVCPQKSHLRGDRVCGHQASARCWHCPGSNQSNVKRVFLAAALTRYRSRAPSRYIAVSQFVAEHHRKWGYAASTIEVIPNFIDYPTATAPRHSQDGHVLFVGPEDPYKGLQVLRAATEELLSRGLPVRVCHVGGPAVYSGDGFIGTGRLTGAALSAAYDNAALLVAPAIYPDPCPTVILEAMAHSLPVVASATGGHADIVTEDTGRLVPVGSSSALANAIETLVRDKDLAAKLGRNGREHCRSFSSDVVIPRIIATYAKVVES